MNTQTKIIIGVGLILLFFSSKANASSISNKGVQFIKSKEGFSRDRYIDASGKPHIGYGHLITPNDGDIKTISKEEAEKLLISDIKIAEKAIKDLVTVKLNQNQFDSLVSFVYNIGRGNFSGSTMLKKLNTNQDVSDEFLRWVYTGGQQSQGLLARRKDEQKMFIG